MIQREVLSPHNCNYDERHDVLHIFLGNTSNSSADEEFPGIYVKRDDRTNKVVGLTVMGFKKRYHSVLDWLPQLDFSKL